MNLSKKIIVVIMSLCIIMSFGKSYNSYAFGNKLNEKKIILIKGETYDLKLKKDKRKVYWYSKKNKVASVNKNGVVRAKSKGTTIITAKTGLRKYTCTVIVENPHLNKAFMRLDVGDKKKIRLKGTKQKVKWSSSDKSVATVSKNGKIKAKKKGASIITANVGNKKFNCIVIIRK